MKFVDDDGSEISPEEWADSIVYFFDGPEDADANCAGIWALAQKILHGSAIAVTSSPASRLSPSAVREADE